MKNERWLICWPIHRESYPGCTGSPQQKPAQYQVTQSAKHREPLFSAGIDQSTANDFRKGDSVFVQLLKVKKNTAIGYHPLLARFRLIFPGFYKSVCNFLILYLYLKKNKNELCKNALWRSEDPKCINKIFCLICRQTEAATLLWIPLHLQSCLSCRGAGKSPSSRW